MSNIWPQGGRKLGREGGGYEQEGNMSCSNHNSEHANARIARWLMGLPRNSSDYIDASTRDIEAVQPVRRNVESNNVTLTMDLQALNVRERLQRTKILQSVGSSTCMRNPAHANFKTGEDVWERQGRTTRSFERTQTRSVQRFNNAAHCRRFNASSSVFSNDNVDGRSMMAHVIESQRIRGAERLKARAHRLIDMAARQRRVDTAADKHGELYNISS
ncbi:hypothetical protein FIBSPDRAFT_895472 [Athelia psychrophila]|uniref:Uncharacterized protein n=1 Tax=Athelia psychrophila TaxID=1759441 RepID=A0A166EIG2_9AGAM|nr:hypothetical protein FIBSPDRAFT_895472 [Fibularhizoctonia sp. CBS 109695]